MIKLKYRLYSHMGWLFAAAMLLCVVLSFRVTGPGGPVAAALILVCLFAIYGLQKQCIADHMRFATLFADYNAAYERLREPLAAICEQGADRQLGKDEKAVLAAYFNLCGEQFCHYCLGHIPPEVWQVWRSTMRAYYYNDRIRNAWDRELSQSAHYGFSRQWLT